MKDRPHGEAMAEHFRVDPAYATELLAEVRRDVNLAELTILLRQMATAFGQDAGRNAADAARKLFPR